MRRLRHKDSTRRDRVVKTAASFDFPATEMAIVSSKLQKSATDFETRAYDMPEFVRKNLRRLRTFARLACENFVQLMHRTCISFLSGFLFPSLQAVLFVSASVESAIRNWKAKVISIELVFPRLPGSELKAEST